MSGMFNKPYEISLWEDYVVYRRQKLKEKKLTKDEYEPGEFYSQNLDEMGGNFGNSLIPYTIDYLPYVKGKEYYVADDLFMEGEAMNDLAIEAGNENWYVDGELVPNTIIQFYKERKLCVIGSDTMGTPLRAFDGKLVVNTNGSSTLTFSMQYKYYDMELEKMMDNPFVKLLVNERKIKLRYGALGAKDTKWYDLIIKNIQENSESKVFSYTAKDLFINELSKSGFGIVMETKLENNTGTVVELGRSVLEGSDWQIPEDHNIILRQTKEDPLYEILLTKNIEPLVMIADGQQEVVTEIKKGEKIYAFYTTVTNCDPYFQFLYVPKEAYEVNEDNVITNSPNYYLENIKYNETTGMPEEIAGDSAQVTLKFRGARIVRQPKTEFDSVLSRYVNIYTDRSEGGEVCGYIEDEYISPVAVNNYVTNASDFDSTAGWKCGGAYQTIEPTEDEESEELRELKEGGEPIGIVTPELTITTLPDVFNRQLIDEDPDLYFKSFLSMTFTSLEQVLFNSGVYDYRHSFNGFTVGAKYLMRLKCGVPNEEQRDLTPLGGLFDVVISEYKLQNGIYTLHGEPYLQFKFSGDLDEDGYSQAEATCEKALSHSELTKTRLGMFFVPSNPEIIGREILLEDAQFFPYLTDMDGIVIVPGSTPKSGVKQHYRFYKKNPDWKTAEEVMYLYDETELPMHDGLPRFAEVYNDDQGFNKIRSITASESNRFNLIQDLCELFECWPKFDIKHNELTGEILLGRDLVDDDGQPLVISEREKYRQQKYLTFHEYIGTQNDLGFKYGINLQAIQRTLESDVIVSKMVVKSNQNEHGVDGFCSIERASESPTGENTIYDFSYYINQQMLDRDIINGDLYLDTAGYLGYFKKLRTWNKDRDRLIVEQSELLTTISKLEANYTTWSTTYQQAEELLNDKKNQLNKLTSYTYEQLIYSNGADETLEEWKENSEVKALCAAIASLNSKIKKYKELSGDTEEGEESTGAKKQLEEAKARDTEIETELKIIKESKLALEIQFYKKYSRFIQEGSWIDENYVDDNLYYLDATSTLHISSQPKVTYSINVLELSQIPEYENYVFSVGDKTFIEDTEFFGWYLKEGILTPRREEIVVNEITIALDNPGQNEIKVQNYKTQFEDLFQRITATTQAIEYSTGKYEKASSVVQADGTILPSTLQNSMANNSFILSNVNDQSVVWDEQGITTTSLSDPSQIVRIVSGGIFMSKDGGASWQTGITGSGINANYITSGQLDTSVIRIMAGGFESFRWDAKGLSAYRFTWDKEQKKGVNFSYSNFVRMDQYGIYGINGYNDFDPFTADEAGKIGVEKIRKYASFSLTWDGFQLRNKYGQGYVSIDSINDFIVSDGTNTRIKIGNLGNTLEPRYGIKIADNTGTSVMETDDNGQLWLKDSLHIETASGNKIGIGKLSGEGFEASRQHGERIISANNNFKVYEDGYMEATGGSFTGTINATGGTIGGLTIEELVEGGYEVEIVSSDNNFIYKNGEGSKIFTFKLYKGTEEVTEGIERIDWLLNENIIGEGKSIEILGEKIGDGAKLTCRVELKEGQNE